MMYSFVGWLWEIVFNIFYEKKWMSRGFLYGPLCPIYGACAFIITGIVKLVSLTGFHVEWWQIALVSFFGSAIVEYITAIILEKLFHAYWWDYSDLPFNYKGKICLFASLLFAVTGVLIIYILNPAFEHFLSLFPELLLEAVGMVLLVIVAMDMTLTISALTDFERKISSMGDSLSERMNIIVEGTFANTSKVYKKTVKKVLGFKYPKETQEKIKKAVDSIED